MTALSNRDYKLAVPVAVSAFRDYPAFLVRTGATRKETAFISELPSDKAQEQPLADFPVPQAFKRGKTFRKKDEKDFHSESKKWFEDRSRIPPAIDPQNELAFMMEKAAALLQQASIEVGLDFGFRTGWSELRKAYQPDLESSRHISRMGLEYPSPNLPQAWPDCMTPVDWQRLGPKTHDVLTKLQNELLMMDDYSALAETATRNKVEKRSGTRPNIALFHDKRQYTLNVNPSEAAPPKQTETDTKSAVSDTKERTAPKREAENVFKQDGPLWRIRFQGHDLGNNHQALKGMGFIAEALRTPRRLVPFSKLYKGHPDHPPGVGNECQDATSAGRELKRTLTARERASFKEQIANLKAEKESADFEKRKELDAKIAQYRKALNETRRFEKDKEPERLRRKVSKNFDKAVEALADGLSGNEAGQKFIVYLRENVRPNKDGIIYNGSDVWAT